MAGKAKLNKFIGLIVIFELLIAAMYICNYLIGRPWTKVVGIVDMDGESSICSWFSTIQLAWVALISGVIALNNSSREKILSWSLWGFPLMFIFLSMDESIQIHEWIGERSDILLEGQSRANTIFSRTGIWFLILGIPFVVVFMSYIYLLKKHFGSIFKYSYFIVGIIIFIVGAVVVEGINNLFPDTATIEGVLCVTLEEYLEMFGITIILWGMLDSCEFRVKEVNCQVASE